MVQELLFDFLLEQIFPPLVSELEMEVSPRDSLWGVIYRHAH